MSLRRGTQWGLAADPAESWRDRAECRDVDQMLFFPERGGTSRQAKQVCSRCRVRRDCLAFALGVESGLPADRRHGVWGGLDGSERWAVAQREQP